MLPIAARVAAGYVPPDMSIQRSQSIFERAKAMNCLCQDRYHDQQAGEIVKRPWGELSFYVEDPWGNGLCFVDEKTLYTGR